MSKNRKARGPARGTLALDLSAVGTADTSKNKLFRSSGPASNVIRLPIFRDGVFIGNEFCPIGPGLRRRIREMARENGR